MGGHVRLSRVAIVLITGGAVLIVAGQLVALVSGQFVRCLEEHEQRSRVQHAEARTEGAGPTAGMGVTAGFLCCMPFLWPAALGWLTVRGEWGPLRGVDSAVLRWGFHAGWAVWCAVCAVMCATCGLGEDVWADRQWEPPGFVVRAVGSCVSVAGYAVAACWRPLRA
jgi:hypothetical protein